MKSRTVKDELPSFPKARWIAVFILSWLLLGLFPTAIVYRQKCPSSFPDANLSQMAGTIGDSFGLVNSFFTGAALLFVIWSIRLQQREIQFAREEWKDNTSSQLEQVRMMKQAASLTATNHIYNHYSNGYGKQDESGVLAAIARGHRRWAIRESFASFDEVFADERKLQVSRETRQLSDLLLTPRAEARYMQSVAALVSSLLVDHRASEDFRKKLWPIYELLRSNPQELVSNEAFHFDAFKKCAADTGTT